jgi:phosphoserine phosphatase RsbU/P
MLDEILRSNRGQVELIAAAWLSGGATRFSVWGRNGLLASWPESVTGQDEDDLRAPVRVAGRTIGTLRVCHPVIHGAQERLDADAAMIGQIATSKRSHCATLSRSSRYLDQASSQPFSPELACDQLRGSDMLECTVSQAAQLANVEGAFVVVRLPGEALQARQWPAGLFTRRALSSYLRHVRELGRPLVYGSGEGFRGKNGGDRSIAAKAANLPARATALATSASIPLPDLLLVPIRVQGEVVAALGLTSRAGTHFAISELNLATAIAQRVGAQIENAALRRSLQLQGNLETEMQIAQRLQRSQLPRRLHRVDGLEVAAETRPASRVGGDFYDLINGDERNLMLTVGDISGKGVSAAMLVAMTRNVIRSNASSQPYLAPQVVMDLSNRALYDDFNDLHMFVTVFTGRYNSVTRELAYANAGHSPVIYYPLGGRAHLLEADGMPIGVFEEMQSRDQQLILRPGDVLVIGTDGLSEASDIRGEMVGYERLAAAVEALAALPASEISRGLFRYVEKIVGFRPQDDDQTVMVLKGN